MTLFLAALSFFVIFYAYFGYALVLYLLVRNKKQSKISNPDLASFSSLTIVIAARNEEQVIDSKLQNTLALTFNGEPIADLLAQNDSILQCIVASDASDDRTHEIVSSYEDKGVELVALDLRAGKETAQLEAVKHVRGEVILFTDAKIFLEGDLQEILSPYFADSSVGIVSSVDTIIADEGESSGEGFYIKYEMALRSLESRFGSLVGVSGSCFAVRTELAEGLSTDIPSDFSLLIEAIKRGYRGVHASNFIAKYKTVRTEKEEFKRKVRTVLRGITTFFSRAEILNPLNFGLFAWQVASHKLARWMVPWAGIVLVVCSFLLSFSSSFFNGLLFLELICFSLALAGWCFPKLSSHSVVKIPLFLVVSNAGILVAWLKYLSGTRSVTWDPSKKGS